MIRTIEKTLIETKKVDTILSAPIKFERKIYWSMATAFLVMHLLFLYSCFWILPFCKLETILYVFGSTTLSVLGLTAGSHRLFAHKCYKVTTPLKIVLVILQTLSGQESVLKWAHDHRQHHKFTDTDADPHNPQVGFFFSHIGWLISSRHPLAIEKRKTIDISDLTSDPIIMFQNKYYWYFFAAISAIAVAIPYYLLEESFYVSFMLGFVFRLIYGLNNAFLINSLAHFYGTKPYEKNIAPADNTLLSFLTFGEGWHNYHHAFPSDYKGSELGLKHSFTTFLIETWAYFGLAYDLKSPSTNLLKSKVVNRGDGSHAIWKNANSSKGSSEKS